MMLDGAAGQDRAVRAISASGQALADQVQDLRLPTVSPAGWARVAAPRPARLRQAACRAAGLAPGALPPRAHRAPRTGSRLRRKGSGRRCGPAPAPASKGQPSGARPARPRPSDRHLERERRGQTDGHPAAVRRQPRSRPARGPTSTRPGDAEATTRAARRRHPARSPLDPGDLAASPPRRVRSAAARGTVSARAATARSSGLPSRPSLPVRIRARAATVREAGPG